MKETPETVIRSFAKLALPARSQMGVEILNCHVRSVRRAPLRRVRGYRVASNVGVVQFPVPDHPYAIVVPQVTFLQWTQLETLRAPHVTLVPPHFRVYSVKIADPGILAQTEYSAKVVRAGHTRRKRRMKFASSAPQARLAIQVRRSALHVQKELSATSQANRPAPCANPR